MELGTIQNLEHLRTTPTELLFRGLSRKAQEDYKNTKILKPQHGSLSVGTGVFFSNRLETALSFSEGTLIITTRELLDPTNKALDTRIKGYDQKAIQKLTKLKGEGNFTGYDIWEEIQQNDTITYEGGPQNSYVYTARKPIKENQILTELSLL